jgi:hypothetical protein
MQIYNKKTQVVILDQRNFPGGSKVIDIVLSLTKKSKPGTLILREACLAPNTNIKQFPGNTPYL